MFSCLAQQVGSAVVLSWWPNCAGIIYQVSAAVILLPLSPSPALTSSPPHAVPRECRPHRAQRRRPAPSRCR
jgi:hypothetical protein